MSLLRSAPLAGLIVLLIVPVARAAGPTPLQSMVTAERAFSTRSVEHGMKDAFLAYLAEDGVIFRPTPTNGRKSWQERESPKATLIWEPAFAEMSAAGDLGYDTGPWELRFPPESKQPPLHGHFVSVWKRASDGEWKVVVDLGVSHEKPDSTGVGSGRLIEGPTRQAVTSGHPEDIRWLDEAYAGRTRISGIGAAFASIAASDVRLNREGLPPFVGLEAARAGMDSLRGSLKFISAGSGLAESHDLAYSYGVAERLGAAAGSKAPAADSSVYLHVWRQGGDHSWKLALEVLNPLPKPKRK